VLAINVISHKILDFAIAHAKQCEAILSTLHVTLFRIRFSFVNQYLCLLSPEIEFCKNRASKSGWGKSFCWCCSAFRI